MLLELFGLAVAALFSAHVPQFCGQSAGRCLSQQHDTMLRAGKRAALGAHLGTTQLSMPRRRPLDRSPPFMTILVVAALLASAALLAGLRGAPLITLLSVGVLGFGVHIGVLSLPAVITTPLARADADVHAWEQRQSAALACDVAQTRALMGEDEREMDGANRLCTSGVWPPIPH